MSEFASSTLEKPVQSPEEILSGAQARETELMAAGFRPYNYFEPDGRVSGLTYEADDGRKRWINLNPENAEEYGSILMRRYGEQNVQMIKGFIRKGDLKKEPWENNGIVSYTHRAVDFRLRPKTDEYAQVYIREDEKAIKELTPAFNEFAREFAVQTDQVPPIEPEAIPGNMPFRHLVLAALTEYAQEKLRKR